MQLKNYRDAAKSFTDYNPTSDLYNAEIDSYVNLAYWALWSRMPWTFAQKEKQFEFYADLNFARTAATVNVTEFEREVTFSVPVLQFEQQWLWEGQVIELSGVDYEILMITDTQTIRLATPYRGDSLAEEETWTIKHKYYYLPEDCIDLLYIGNSGSPVPGSGFAYNGKQIALAQNRKEAMNLEEDLTSDTASHYFNLSPANIPPGEQIAYELEPDLGNIPDNEYYEICWAVETKGGRVGPLSQPVIAHTTESQGAGWGITISFLTWDDQPYQAQAFAAATDTYQNPFEGLRKRLYFNQNFNRTTGERKGLPLWREITEWDPLLRVQYRHQPLRAQDTDASITLLSIAGLNPGNPRYIENDGQHQRIQPFPRIDSFDFHYTQTPAGTPLPEEAFVQYGNIRYFYKPHMLCTLTDSPEMPFEMHDIINWMVCEDLARKHGDMAAVTLYQRRVEKRVKDLTRTYGGKTDINHIKIGFGRGGGYMTDGTLTANGVKY